MRSASVVERSGWRGVAPGAGLPPMIGSRPSGDDEGLEQLQMLVVEVQESVGAGREQADLLQLEDGAHGELKDFC